MIIWGPAKKQNSKKKLTTKSRDTVPLSYPRMGCLIMERSDFLFSVRSVNYRSVNTVCPV